MIQICVEFNGMCKIIIGNGFSVCMPCGRCAVCAACTRNTYMRVSCTCICTLMRGRERRGEEGKENQEGRERESKRGGEVNEIGSKGVEWNY